MKEGERRLNWLPRPQVTTMILPTRLLPLPSSLHTAIIRQHLPPRSLPRPRVSSTVCSSSISTTTNATRDGYSSSTITTSTINSKKAHGITTHEDKIYTHI